MNRSIFISRDLNENSILLNSLHKAGWKIEAKSLIRIVPLDFEFNELKSDWIFLSSSNGARVLLENFKPNSLVKLGAVGEATARTIRTFGFEPEFIGRSGNMNEVGINFKKIVKEDKVLFIGTENGSGKVRCFFKKEQTQFRPIYRTELLLNEVIGETEFVFLTSPSNATAYLSGSSLDGKKVIAIGNTTAEFLYEAGAKDVFIPESPEEEDVLELLLRL